MSENTRIMENSLCKQCSNRICRKIIPPEYYWEELGEDIDDESDNDDGIIEHNYCLLLQMLLDHVVLDCNKFYSEVEVVLIQNENMIEG